MFWKLSFSSFLHESVHVQTEYSDYCGISNTKWFPDRVATKFYESFSQFQYIFRKKWGSGFVNLWFIMNIEDKIWKTNGLSRISELALKMLRRPLIKMWIFERKSSRQIEHLQYSSKSGKRLNRFGEIIARHRRKSYFQISTIFGRITSFVHLCLSISNNLPLSGNHQLFIKTPTNIGRAKKKESRRNFDRV